MGEKKPKGHKKNQKYIQKVWDIGEFKYYFYMLFAYNLLLKYN